MNDRSQAIALVAGLTILALALWVRLIILTIDLWAMLHTAAQCHAAGGTTVRGLIWLQGIR